MQEPAETKQWKKQAASRASVARNLSNQMRNTLRNYEEQEASAKASQLDFAEQQAERVRKEARGHIKFHQEAIEESQDYMRQIGKATCKLDSVLKKLMHERYARHGDLQVCQRRMQMRDKRPPQENIKDCLQLQLETECALLTAQRDEMLKREAEVKKHRDSLARLRASLTKDTGHRRLHMGHEQTGIRLAKDIANGKEEFPSMDKLPPTTDTYLKKSVYMLRPHGEVEKFCDRAMELVDRSQTDAKLTYISVTKAFENRDAELVKVKQRLEEEHKELIRLIDIAETDLEKYTRRADPKDVLKGEQLKQSKLLLSQLKQARDEMHSDLLNKITCLEIDHACRRVRPMHAYLDLEEEGAAQPISDTILPPTPSKSSTGKDAKAAPQQGLSKSESAPCLPSVSGGSRNGTARSGFMETAPCTVGGV